MSSDLPPLPSRDRVSAIHPHKSTPKGPLPSDALLPPLPIRDRTSRPPSVDRSKMAELMNAVDDSSSSSEDGEQPQSPVPPPAVDEATQLTAPSSTIDTDGAGDAPPVRSPPQPSSTPPPSSLDDGEGGDSVSSGGTCDDERDSQDDNNDAQPPSQDVPPARAPPTVTVHAPATGSIDGKSSLPPPGAARRSGSARRPRGVVGPGRRAMPGRGSPARGVARRGVGRVRGARGSPARRGMRGGLRGVPGRGHARAGPAGARAAMMRGPQSLSLQRLPTHTRPSPGGGKVLSPSLRGVDVRGVRGAMVMAAASRDALASAKPLSPSLAHVNTVSGGVSSGLAINPSMLGPARGNLGLVGGATTGAAPEAAAPPHSAAPGPGDAEDSSIHRVSLDGVLSRLVGPDGPSWERKAKKWKKVSYERWISGASLMEWFISTGLAANETQAVMLGNMMGEAGVLEPLQKDTIFKGKKKEAWALSSPTTGEDASAHAIMLPTSSSAGGDTSPTEDAAEVDKRGEKERAKQEEKRRKEEAKLVEKKKKEEEKEKRRLEKEKKKEEKKKLKKSKGKKVSPVFGVDISSVMELQPPDAGPIPLFLVHLRDALFTLGADRTEGIFRIPGNTLGIQDLKAQFNAQDYTVDEDDPHVVAGCLKQWLRELPEPLIPNTLYDESIAAAKSSQAAALAIIDRIPPVCREIAVFIADMLRKFAIHEDETMMGRDNLAMVFAPGFLRCEDPTQMMVNSTYEKDFVSHIIDGLME